MTERWLQMKEMELHWLNIKKKRNEKSYIYMDVAGWRPVIEKIRKLMLLLRIWNGLW